jgi:hypothetical protein
MKKNSEQLSKKNTKKDSSEHSENHQDNNKNISDKISENRNVGGLTDRDDAPGSGISISDPTEHTLGNP